MSNDQQNVLHNSIFQSLMDSTMEETRILATDTGFATDSSYVHDSILQEGVTLTSTQTKSLDNKPKHYQWYTELTLQKQTFPAHFSNI